MGWTGNAASAGFFFIIIFFLIWICYNAGVPARASKQRPRAAATPMPWMDQQHAARLWRGGAQPTSQWWKRPWLGAHPHPYLPSPSPLTLNPDPSPRPSTLSLNPDPGPQPTL